MGTHPCVVWFCSKVLSRSQAEAATIEPLSQQPQHPHAPPEGSPSIKRPGLSYAGKSQNFQCLWKSSSKRDSNWSLHTHRTSGCNGEMCLHATHRIPSRMGPRRTQKPTQKIPSPTQGISLSQAHLSASNSFLASLSNCSHVPGSGSSWGEQAEAKSYGISFLLSF